MPENKFEWTDELVRQFILERWDFLPRYYNQSLEDFKKSKESNLPNKYWEILYIKNTNTHNNIYWRSHYGNYWINGLGERFEYDFSTGSIKKGCEIHSIRRLSDGVEFQIGDRICSKVNIPNSFTIEKIQIINDNFIYLDSCPLENAFHLGTEPKVPLFTTDQVEEIVSLIKKHLNG